MGILLGLLLCQAGAVFRAPVLPGGIQPVPVIVAPRLPAAFRLRAAAPAPVLPAPILTPAVPFAVPLPAQPVSALSLLRASAGRLTSPKGSSPEAVLDRLFDLPSVPSAALPDSFLAVARPADRPLVMAALAEARRSPSGRRVLSRAERHLARKPLRVEVRDLKGDYGEFDYMNRVLRLDRRQLSEVGMAAATLVHELLHVLQHEEGIPAEALEMELEAHLVTFDVMRELGVPVPKGGFSEAALAALAKGPRAYADWMAGQLPGKTRLAHSSLAEVESRLEDEVEELRDMADAASDSRRERILGRLAWAERDLELVRSPEGRRAYQSFARRVMDLVRRRASAG